MIASNNIRGNILHATPAIINRIYNITNSTTITTNTMITAICTTHTTFSEPL